MKYDAVVFDLLTALIDSWSLWNSVAGSPEAGMVWRRRYLEITYGCGNGSGGSDVRFEFAPTGSTAEPQALSYTVQETGGFQNFVPRMLGEVTFDKPGRYEVRIKAVKKPGVAVMDLRQARLIPEK